MPGRSRRPAWVAPKYLAFQTPGWLIAAGLALLAVRRFEVSPLVAWSLAALWVLKDLILYPYLRDSYAPGPKDAAAQLVGASAIATEPLAPAGYARVGAELWRAELKQGCGVAPAGARLRVFAVRGLTLVVEPLLAGEDAPDAS